MKPNGELGNIMDIEYTTVKSDPIIISNDKELEKAKKEILKCFYIGIYRKDTALSVVCDNGKYYIINLDNNFKKTLMNTFNFIKPKKIVFDITDYKLILNDNSKGFVDIRLAINLLFNEKFKTISEFIIGFKIPLEARSNIYLLYANLIKIAKNINIYVEKNGLNKAYYTEMDTSILMSNVVKRGISIDLNLYKEFKNTLAKDVDIILKKMNVKYGNDFDFEDKENILKAVKEGPRSLEPRLMDISKNPLYDNYKKYSLYKRIESLSVDGDKIFFNYSLYDDFQIKSNLSIEGNFYGNNKSEVIKGKFGDLYYKVFAELTRDNNLITAASENNFIEYINETLFSSEEQKMFPYTSIILHCYANNIFEHFEVQEYALKNYDTILNVGYISDFNYRIQEHLESFYNLIVNFDGLSPEYDRYNKKIFTPHSSLDGYIKQIINVIFKLSLLDIEGMSRDYTDKRTRQDNGSIVLSGVGKDFILLSVTGEDARQLAIDNLNRVMYRHYKYFVKNTKVYNITSQLYK